jgi:phage tail-like protein
VKVAAAQIDDFQPLAGPARERPAQTFPGGIDLAAWTIDPIAVVGIDEHAVLLLDRDATAGRSRVVRLRRDGGTWQAEPSRWLGETEIGGLAHDLVVAETRLYQSDTAARILFITTSSGNQARAYRITDAAASFGIEAATELFPLRRYAGRALITVRGEGRYDSGLAQPVWTPIVQQPRPRFHARAEFVTPVFDSFELATTWDRALFDGCIPPDTAVRVFSRAGDERSDAGESFPASPQAAAEAIGEWIEEPAPQLRATGPELPWLRAEAARATRAESGVGTWELLLQHAHGRYLQLRIVLESASGTATPRLRALRVWSPRFAWPQRFLPAVYREDPVSGPFLERWLANLESTMTAIEDRIVNVRALFDPRSAPAETLAWLAEWFDVALDPAWDERRRRLFVRRAMDFFRWRGTVHGLRLALELAFDPCIDDAMFDGPRDGDGGARRIRIVEAYQTRVFGAAAAGDPAGVAVGPREVRPEERWTPGEGNAGLVERWARFEGRTATAAELIAPFEFAAPFDPALDAAANAARQSKWRAFCETALGFVPAIGAAERSRWQAHRVARYFGDPTSTPDKAVAAQLAAARLPRDEPGTNDEREAWRAFLPRSDGLWTRARWQDFLASRYRRIERLNAAWQTAWSAFDQVALHDVLADTTAAQTDWLQFEGRVLSMHGTAHRFSVLLPLADVTADPYQLEERLGLARRIVELEKPAHTVFDVRFYWAFNRVGEARLGLDTQLGAGSRAPELIPTAVLGRAYVGASFVGGAGRPQAADRLLVEC